MRRSRGSVRGISALMAVLMVATAAACGDDAGDGIRIPPPGSTATATSSALEATPSAEATPDPVEAYAYCLTTPAERAHFRQLHTGTDSVDAIEYGSGTVGVLLSHQSDGDLCQWLGEAKRLAGQGYLVLAPTYFGRDFDQVVDACVRRLKRDGAKGIVLVGASMGGTISLAMATEIRPRPLAVVSLSGPAASAGFEVDKTIGGLAAPVFLAAGGDDVGFADDAPLLYRKATHAADRELLVVRGDSRHGVELLTSDPGGSRSRVRDAMEAFLAEHAPPR